MKVQETLVAMEEERDECDKRAHENEEKLIERETRFIEELKKDEEIISVLKQEISNMILNVRNLLSKLNLNI